MGIQEDNMTLNNLKANQPSSESKSPDSVTRSTKAGPVHPRLGIPELGGICRYDEVGKPGFGVEENVGRLKRYNWVETRLTDLFLTRLTATPEWEVKAAFSLHVWLDAEHAQSLQQRIAEMRHPPHNFHVPPDPALEAWLQEALRSRGTVELLVALYRVIKPALLEAYRTHSERTNPLVDHPTRRILRFMILEEEDMIRWGEAALQALVHDDETRAHAEAWEAHLRAYLAAAGGIWDEGVTCERVMEVNEQARPAGSSVHPLTPSPPHPLSARHRAAGAGLDATAG